MGQIIESRFDLFKLLIRSPWAWVSTIPSVLGIYSLVRGEFYPWLPPLADFMPLWAWAMLALVLFPVALFETSYRYARSIQPPQISKIGALLRRRQIIGFEIRKNVKEGWETQAREWYADVLSDLGLIFGQDYARRFDIEMGRESSIKMADGSKNPKITVVRASEKLEKIERELTRDQIHPAPELSSRIQEILSK